MLWNSLANIFSHCSILNVQIVWLILVRNAGNLVPNAQHFQDEYYSCEPAALELGCVVNNIRHIIVCGHSDCKAMNLLYTLRNKEESAPDQRRISPLKAWLCAHAANSSLERFLRWEEAGMKDPLVFSSETPLRKFIAYIDPENKFNVEDKLSQINTLEQCRCFISAINIALIHWYAFFCVCAISVSNVASYGFLKKRLETHNLHIHALWFDIYTGDIYYFSRGQKRFVHVDEENSEQIIEEINRFYT